MATRYTGRCGVAGCRWQFTARSTAVITELYGNHFTKAHSGIGTLTIEPGGLAIPWPPDNDELVRLNLAEPASQSSARASRLLRITSACSAAFTACMVVIAVFLVINPAWKSMSRAALGDPLLWVGFFLPAALFSTGGMLGSFRVTRAHATPGVRRGTFALLIAASVSDTLLGILLWAGIITIADMSVNGELPNAFSNLYLLAWLLAGISFLTLSGSLIIFSRAAKSQSSA